MKRLKLTLLTAALLAINSASAHEAKGPHGGRVVDAGNYHLELVVRGSDVALFVTDGNEKPIAATGFKAVAILNADGKAQRVALEAGDAAKISGKAETALPTDVKVVVQLTAPDGKIRQGQFK
jgi:hypothetical protein